MTSQMFADSFKRGIARSGRAVRRGLLLALAILCIGLPVWSQSPDDTVRERKLITRVEPKYPTTLERLYIGGVVKLEVVVAPNGSVETATLMGGNPILGQSAITAVKQWKYATGATKTKLVERLEFDPHR
jgi:TonB family protein